MASVASNLRNTPLHLASSLPTHTALKLLPAPGPACGKRERVFPLPSQRSADPPLKAIAGNCSASQSLQAARPPAACTTSGLLRSTLPQYFDHRQNRKPSLGSGSPSQRRERMVTPGLSFHRIPGAFIPNPAYAKFAGGRVPFVRSVPGAASLHSPPQTP